MKKILRGAMFILAILLVGGKADAQTIRTDSIFLTGAVMDQKNLTALPYAHYKVNRKMAGTANAFGRFSFWVNSGDTIHYSYVGYQDLNVVVSDSLTKDTYLFGVFMTKDTVALQEVLIVPRFGDFKEAFMNTKVNTPEYVRAKNNVNSATYEALTKRPKKMDAKANTDMQINQFIVESQNQTMVPTERITGVSTERTLPEVKRLKRKKKLIIPDNLITDDEIKTLQQMYRYGVKKKK
jgi:hypothetical protein